MAELLTGKHKPEEDNNNYCIAKDKDHDDDVTRVKPVIKFDTLSDRQLRIPNLRKKDDDDDDGETSASYSATEKENNYNLSLTKFDCCPEMTTVDPDDLDKINEEITTGSPPAVKEWIDQAQNRIDRFESSLSDAAISAEKNIHTTVCQEIKSNMDRHETSGWMEDFELKLEESHDELENDEKHDSNNDSRKDDFMETSPRKSPIKRRNSCKATENHGNVMKEIVDQKIKDSVESAPKTANAKKNNPKKQPTNQTTLLQYLSLRKSQITSSEVQKPQVEPKKEATISTTAKLLDGMENLLNAKVVLEKLPLSLLPDAPNSNDGINYSDQKIAKVQIAAQSSNKTPKRESSKFKRYCLKCKTCVDSNSAQKDLKCSKCSRNLIFLCVICNSQFEGYSKLSYHLRTKCSVSKQFECEHCDYKTPVKIHLKNHGERRHNLNKENAITNLKCSKCKAEFKQELTLKKHLVDCKGRSKKSETDASSKVKTESNSIERNCPKCRKTITTTTLSESCPGCATPLEFTCLKCDDTFWKHSCIVHHLKADCDEFYRERLFHCPHCIRLPRDTMNCMLCTYKASAIFKLIEHLKLDHTMTSSGANGEMQRHTCTKCGKEFAKKTYLNVHEKLCGTNVAIIKCKICEFETRLASSIKRHMHLVHAIRC